MTKEYVAGFLFDDSLSRVLLIKKNRPEWQAGKLNGVGGKIEFGENALQAMTREFKEETGVTVGFWNPFAVLKGKNGTWDVNFFHAVSSQKMSGVRNMTDELLIVSEVRKVLLLSTLPACLPNVCWLVRMALNDIQGIDLCTLFTVCELESRECQR